MKYVAAGILSIVIAAWGASFAIDLLPNHEGAILITTAVSMCCGVASVVYGVDRVR